VSPDAAGEPPLLHPSREEGAGCARGWEGAGCLEHYVTPSTSLTSSGYLAELVKGHLTGQRPIMGRNGVASTLAVLRLGLPGRAGCGADSDQARLRRLSAVERIAWLGPTRSRPPLRRRRATAHAAENVGFV
jgi:hypothetical protein